jgi:hypothetical protein
LAQVIAAAFLAMAYRDLGATDKLGDVEANLREQLADLERRGTPFSAHLAPWSFRFTVDAVRRNLTPDHDSSAVLRVKQ